MATETNHWVDVLRVADARACAECALVLEACGIEYRSERVGFRYVLSVRSPDLAAAERELEGYLRENAGPRLRRPPLEMFGNAWPGLAVYAAVLLLVMLWAQNYAFGFNWLAAGRMDSARLLDGEWWRALTALSLHVDADHLFANLAFGAFFAYFLCRYVGGGVGWLGIVLSGGLGNFFNALLQSPGHRSIGASTAVFGALALLTANTWRRNWSKALPLRVRAAPLIAGIALLAYTGTGGANTDVGAHLWGFVSGLALGFALTFYPALRAPWIQRTAAAVAAASMALAWIAALAASA